MMIEGELQKGDLVNDGEQNKNKKRNLDCGLLRHLFLFLLLFPFPLVS
jgi:hypothetical protein